MKSISTNDYYKRVRDAFIENEGVLATLIHAQEIINSLNQQNVSRILTEICLLIKKRKITSLEICESIVSAYYINPIDYNLFILFIENINFQISPNDNNFLRDFVSVVENRWILNFFDSEITFLLYFLYERNLYNIKRVKFLIEDYNQQHMDDLIEPSFISPLLADIFESDYVEYMERFNKDITDCYFIENNNYFNIYKQFSIFNIEKKDINESKNIEKENNYDLLKRDNWKIHKEAREKMTNPNLLFITLKNDNIDLFQELHPDKLDDTIPKSIYEVHHLINNEDPYLIEVAAFFGSIKCFKFLFLNGAKFTSKLFYLALEGGNAEIIHIVDGNLHLYGINAEDTPLSTNNQNYNIFRWRFDNSSHAGNINISNPKYKNIFSSLDLKALNFLILNNTVPNHLDIYFTQYNQITLLKSMFFMKNCKYNDYHIFEFLLVSSSEVMISFLYEFLENKDIMFTTKMIILLVKGKFEILSFLFKKAKEKHISIDLYCFRAKMINLHNNNLFQYLNNGSFRKIIYFLKNDISLNIDIADHAIYNFISEIPKNGTY